MQAGGLQWRIQSVYQGEGGIHGERAEREPITGVWGQNPQRGPGTEPLVGFRGAKPPEAESFSVLRRRKETVNLPLSCVLGSGLAYCT